MDKVLLVTLLAVLGVLALIFSYLATAVLSRRRQSCRKYRSAKQSDKHQEMVENIADTVIDDAPCDRRPRRSRRDDDDTEDGLLGKIRGFFRDFDPDDYD